MPSEKNAVDEIIQEENLKLFYVFYDSYDQHEELVDIFEDIALYAEDKEHCIQLFKAHQNFDLQYNILCITDASNFKVSSSED